jgi:hypothetical protein
LGPLKKNSGIYYTTKSDNENEPYYKMRLPHMTTSVIEQYAISEYGIKHPLKDECSSNRRHYAREKNRRREDD